MKTKTEKPKAAIVVTSKARLTIKGVTHDLSLEELREVYNTIGATLGESVKDAKIARLMKDLEDANERASKAMRDKYPTPAQWPHIFPKNAPVRSPLPWENLIMCEVSTAHPAGITIGQARSIAGFQ